MVLGKHLKIVLAALLSTGFICIQAEENVPVVKAKSKVISIRDGIHFRKNLWHLDPSVGLDTYYADLPLKPHHVTFITDVDSITFHIKPGNVYDFIILLNEKDSCHTRILANLRGNTTYTRIAKDAGPDTLHFTMHQSRIYFKGKLNQYEGALFQFDLGAGMSAVNHRSVSKAKIQFDANTILVNSQGSNEALVSKSTTIQIGGLQWEKVSMVRTKNMDNYEDAIIGNFLFEDKIAEIDYDRKIMVLHDSLPPVTNDYSKHEVIYVQHRPFIRASIIEGGKVYTDWFLFDTGRDGNMVLRDSFFRKNYIWNQLKTVFLLGNKHVKVVPQLKIGEKIFTDIITPAYSPDKMHTDLPNILGNRLLCHFNVILDNHNGFIYLKPNNLNRIPYENLSSFKRKAVMILLGVSAVLSISVFVFLRIRKKKRSSQKLSQE